MLVVSDGTRHGCLGARRRPGRHGIERLVERSGMPKLEDVVDVGLLDAVPHCLEIEKNGVAGTDPNRPCAWPIAVALEQALADRVRAKERLLRRDLNEAEAVPGQL